MFLIFIIFTSKFLPKYLFNSIGEFFMQKTENHHIRFSKYHGAGNDFIMINAISEELLLPEELIARICNRRIGVGADGLIVLLPSDEHDFRMKYYNCDGKESTFCGNGGRCIAAFAHQEGIVNNLADYEAIDGLHKAIIHKINENDFYVELTMSDILSYDINDERLIINTGSPHYVKKTNDLDKIDINKEGADIRYDKKVSEDGVNVDFLSFVNDIVRIRTYERGVENETLACGTGVTASAIAASLWYGGDNIDVYTRIAKLNVKFTKVNNTFKNVILSGPATFVFDGMFIFAN